jgi:cytochrome P450
MKIINCDVGPIIRIHPHGATSTSFERFVADHHQVHIEDSEYYDELYNNNYKWDKYWLYINQFNTPGAVISTIEHDVHRARRKPENNFFSKRSVVALEPMIHRNLDKLCARMRQFRDSKTVFSLNTAMLCFTSDVVSEYAFDTSYNLLETDDLSPSMLAANKKTGEYSHAMKQFPWLLQVFNFLSQEWIARSVRTSD